MGTGESGVEVKTGCRREWSVGEDGVLERVGWGRRRGARESGMGAKTGC